MTWKISERSGLQNPILDSDGSYLLGTNFFLQLNVLQRHVNEHNENK